MGDIIDFSLSKPRIRILDLPRASEKIPEWFLQELIGLIVPVEAMIQGYIHFSGEEILLFKISKKKLRQALLRKSRNAADFLKESPLFPEEYLCINSEVCDFLGSWRELKCEIASAK